MSTLSERVADAKRRPRRITVTMSEMTLERLHTAAVNEGRSASNLACYLIEIGLEQRPQISAF